MSCAKTAELIKMLFGIWTQVSPRKYVLDGAHIGATWRTRMNHFCAAVMQPYIKLL